MTTRTSRDDLDRFRNEVRTWLDANAPDEPLPSGDSPEGFKACRDWERRLFDAGWAVVAWPKEYGGRGASMWEWLIFEEEYYRAGLPQRVAQNGIFLLAPTMFEFGTDDQRRRYLARIASTEDIWCQGWSEPEAGSDLASLTARAVRDERAGGWRLHGQKSWSTRGAYSTHMFGLFRTGEREQRHKGLTYFLIDLQQPGVTVRPVARLDGDEGFADVFFDGVLVPDADVLGGVGEGWRVAMATAGSERSLSLRSPGRFLAGADRLVEAIRGRPGAAHDPRLRAAVADSWMAARAYQLSTDSVVARMLDGHPLGAEASLSKIFWSELDIALHETALLVQGAEAGRDDDWMRGYEFALAGPIYAGTNEIQRNIIAERILGLPRK